MCMRNRTTESDRHNDICGLQKIRVYSRKMVFQLHIYPVIILKLYCLWRYTTIYIAMLFKKTQSHNNFLDSIFILKCIKHIVLLLTLTKKKFVVWLIILEVTYSRKYYKNKGTTISGCHKHIFLHFFCNLQKKNANPSSPPQISCTIQNCLLPKISEQYPNFIHPSAHFLSHKGINVNHLPIEVEEESNCCPQFNKLSIGIPSSMQMTVIYAWRNLKYFSLEN